MGTDPAVCNMVQHQIQQIKNIKTIKNQFETVELVNNHTNITIYLFIKLTKLQSHSLYIIKVNQINLII